MNANEIRDALTNARLDCVASLKRLRSLDQQLAGPAEGTLSQTLDYLVSAAYGFDDLLAMQYGGTCWCGRPGEYVNPDAEGSIAHRCCAEHVKDGYARVGLTEEAAE